RRLRDLAVEIRAAQARKDAVERTAAALAAEEPRLRARVVARVRGLYRLHQRGLAPIVFQAPRDWGEAIRYQRSLEAVLAYDRGLAAELRRNRAEAAAAREQAAAEASTLAQRRQESARELQSLRAERAAKQAMLASLRGEGEKRTRLLEELKSSAEKLRELIESEEAAKAPPFEAPAGVTASMRLPLPSLGDAVASARNGVEIRAAAGTAIQAVKTGRVVFAGWFAGYGKMVILDHGDHLYTVYGYAEELLVESGRVVDAGDPIATVGATGPVATPSLYFEIRERGVPRDPGSYIPALARK
ncbi:MAG TPA: peptidoglycan DD-metalloendopeptidase family protein, partial [Candidatus Binatia bacterium]|nr:peptidoglycan DD-metalloendopeptidase family protein [Candidatus Binatia bacterium]